jgi:hypothetical protein
MWSSSRKQRRALGAFDLTTVKEAALKRISLGPVQVPVAVLAAAGAYGILIFTRMFKARNTEADGTTEQEYDRPSTGPCSNIEDQFDTPIGCGTVGVTGYRKTGFQKAEAAKIQLTELAPYPGFYLQSAPTNTHAAFLRMRAAAMADGISIKLNSAFRTMGKQRALYKRYIQGKGALASYPGTSPHQMGRAVDIQTAGGTLPIYFWLKKNGERFGFYRTVPSEPWHYHYYPDRDQSLKE